jgi:hypothetical protein
VAIKLIEDGYSNVHNFKRVVREVQILIQLSKMKNNIFTTKLIDIVADGDRIFLIMDFQISDLKQLLVE